MNVNAVARFQSRVLLTGSTRGEDHVGYLEHALGAAGASANDGLRYKSNEHHSNSTHVFRRHTIVVVEEGIASSKYGRPCLANDLATRRNGDRVRHDVDTRVKEYDPAARELFKHSAIPSAPMLPPDRRSGDETNLVKHGLNGSGVVRLPIALRALRLDADELARRVIRVLRVRLPEYPA